MAKKLDPIAELKTTVEALESRLGLIEGCFRDKLKLHRGWLAECEQRQAVNDRHKQLEPLRLKLFRAFKQECLQLGAGHATFVWAVAGAYKSWIETKIRADEFDQNERDHVTLSADELDICMAKLPGVEKAVMKNFRGARLWAYQGCSLKLEVRPEQDIDAERRVKNTQPVDTSDIEALAAASA